MYWTEAQSGLVEVANMDTGSGRRVLLRANDTDFPDHVSANKQDGKEAHFYGVTIDDEHIYFTDWTRG